MKTKANDNGGRRQPNCNVDSTFNFTAGGVAIAVALLIGYWVYLYW